MSLILMNLLAAAGWTESLSTWISSSPSILLYSSTTRFTIPSAFGFLEKNKVLKLIQLFRYDCCTPHRYPCLRP